MPNIPTNYEFLNKWKDFFDLVKSAGLAEIKNAGSPFDRLEVPFKRVISFLVNKQTLDSLDKKIKQIKVEDHGNIMIATLFIEMDIVVSLLQDSQPSNRAHALSERQILAAGQTVTGSIGSLFTPPNRVNKLFKVLDDMLSLIMSG